MLTIGIVAVTNKAASSVYNTIIQEGLLQNRGTHPEIILHSLPFGEYESALRENAKGNPSELIQVVTKSLVTLKGAGAQLAIIPNNSAHTVFRQLISGSPLPILSIMDGVVQECIEKGYASVCLLGPTPVIAKRLFADPLEKKGITCVTPDAQEQAFIHDFITRAGSNPQVDAKDVTHIQSIYKRLKQEYQFDGLVLACSELTVLFTHSDAKVPILDPFVLLARKALVQAISVNKTPLNHQCI